MIVKRTSVACRCNRKSCQSRRRLPKHPDEYVRRPRCRSCGKGFYRPDPYRNSGREHAEKTCRCDHYSFPHARGRGFCRFNPHLTPEMLQERELTGVWA